MGLCAACGEDNPARARFCLGCGTSLGMTSVAVSAHEVRKVVTVVFCDLTGSTDLGERLDVEALRALLDRYFATMSEILERHGGSVEKFIGDAVMAVFGVPVLHEDDALRAVRAAAEMSLAMSDLAHELDSTWGVRPHVRIGVSTGEVLAGDSAGRQRLATGDAVNVAARLESAARAGQVVISQDTYRLVHDAVDVEALPPLRLKGKSEPVPAYLVLGVSDRSEGFARRLDAPLVGRTEELADLTRAYDRALGGGPHPRAVVVGMAGIGKSRLVGAFLDRVGAQATVLRGQCLPYGQGITFWPVREMVRGVAGWSVEDTPDEVVRRVAEVMPGERDGEVVARSVAALCGLTASPGRIEEGFWGVGRLLESLARWHPVLVVVDDVHWAEPALLDLLEHLARVPGPILQLLCARPEFYDAHPDWGSGDLRVELRQLPGEACDLLVEAVLGTRRVAASIREHVRAAADGNPLFVEQLVAAMREDAVIVESSAGWVGTEQLTARAVPLSIQALLRSRLERLSAAEQADIHAASVVGRVFWRSAVAELAHEAAGAAAGSHLLGLVGRDLISPDDSDFDEDEAYRFQHILVRDAAYSALPKAARADAHERFPEWLLAAAGERVGEYDEILGYHLEQAYELRASLAAVGPRERRLARAAGDRLSTAGRRAFTRGDIAAAVNLLQRAHRLLSSDPGPRLSVVPTLAEALVWLGDMPAAMALLDMSLAEGKALGDRRVTMHVALAKAALRNSDEATDVQRSTAREAVAVFSAAGDDDGLARALMLTGQVHLAEGRTGDAEAAWTAALGPARRAAPEQAEETEMWLASYSVFGPTPFRVVSDRLDAIAVKVAGKPYREATLLRGRAHVAAARGDFPAAHGFLSRAREMYAALGLHYVGALVSQTAYEVALRQDDLLAALPQLEADDRALAHIGDRWSRSTTTAMLAHSLASAARFSDALSSADEARELTSAGDLQSQVLWRTALARALAGSGRLDEGLQHVREALSMVAPSDWLCLHADALLVQAELLHQSGDEARRRSAVERAVELYTAKGDDASRARAARARAAHR